MPTATPGPTGVPTAIYYVSPNGSDSTGNGSAGNPWKTLGKAASSVSAMGSLIRMAAGNYAESTTLNLAKGVSIEGAGIDQTIIKSSVSGDWSEFLVLESPVDTNGAQTLSGFTLDGQYVSESNYKTWFGVRISGRSNVVMHDTKVINFRDRGVIFDGHRVQNPLTDPGHHATGNKFYNNIILNSAAQNNNYGSGLLNIGGQLDMEIYNNTLIQDQRGQFKNGWPIKYWENGFLKGVKIHHNTLIKKAYDGTYPGEGGNWDFAIELFNVSGVEFAYNNVQGSVDINYDYKGSYPYSVWIHHNTLNHPTINTKFESGIILEFAVQSVIIENNVINNYCTGVQFNTRTPSNSGGYLYPAPTGGYSSLTNNIIRNNVFSNLYQPGAGIVGTGGAVLVVSEQGNDPYIRNLQIYNNVFHAKSGQAPWFGIDFTSQENGDVNGVYIKNNIIVGFLDSWIRGSQPRTNMTNVVITNNDAYNNGNGNAPLWPSGNPASYTYSANMSVNPMFVSGTDFHLQLSSPLINKGVNVGIPFLGVAPDIGAFEMQ